MSGDKQFLMSGDEDELLKRAIQLVFDQRGSNTTASGWYEETSCCGLVLTWAGDVEGITPMPSDMNAEGCYPIVKTWLKNEEVNDEYTKQEIDLHYFDGSTHRGWVVYTGCQDMTENNFYTICRIIPEVILYGK